MTTILSRSTLGACLVYRRLQCPSFVPRLDNIVDISHECRLSNIVKLEGSGHSVSKNDIHVAAAADVKW